MRLKMNNKKLKTNIQVEAINAFTSVIYSYKFHASISRKTQLRLINYIDCGLLI